MTMVALPRRYTPEEFLRIPDSQHFELIDGELVEKEMSALACYVAGLLFEFLQAHIRKTGCGIAFPDGTTYRCIDHKPDLIRRPDCSFIQASRYSLHDLQEEGHILVVPDLVAEVVSTHDTVYEVDLRIADYLQAGVQIVWILNPKQQTIAIHRQQGPGSIVGVNNDLVGEGSLRGFAVRVSEVFALPAWLSAGKVS